MIEALVTKMVPSLAPSFPLFAKTPWSFILVSSDVEGGHPFTRGGHIVLTASALVPIREQMRTGANEWVALAESGKLLLHEQLHVVQRQHPERFAKMYGEYWGFKHAGSIAPADWLTDHQMLDPDAVDANWVFELKDGQRPSRWIRPMAVLAEARQSTGPTFADMQMVAVMLEPAGEDGAFRPKIAPNGNPMMDGLMNFPQFTARFAPSQSAFHPNEASADLFAHIAVIEDILPSRAPEEAKAALEKGKAAFKPTREWFEKILGPG